ncbi:phage holin family protein [Synechococcus sp. Cruz-9H2]|jgi:putative membrane protein|uniref:phage holin family protein n=1 Tax=unclassified Synechococcus TaxID=2626047 RepID=UPI0020CC80EA|nr:MULTISPECIES: phage holin family protein [unclassified Synechococcus]MCP9819478.1 phage holin family protein [Synechococcus sp. Cruz-9H2]MCP9843782.1 phage holin family protein [Synechococcus sp. Edmonson 11F2]MCP9855860.1 phage holin family protein [Synechococcus sp. Cruz-9C9]MCP9863192.1 phage holin family protein [Synechococcus sp. Cruz-7E5]MCP9870495.1 phage holin family protein [Synechococcus sp. Cruz-7B9]
MGPFLWLLQWPIRALVLLFVGVLPLGVEFNSFGTALLSAAVIGLLGTLLIWPLRLVLALPWALTSLGGMVTPITAVYNWVITIVLFALAAWLIQGFRLKNGLISAALGAIVYSVLSTLILGWLGLDVSFTRASAALSAAVGVG